MEDLLANVKILKNIDIFLYVIAGWLVLVTFLVGIERNRRLLREVNDEELEKRVAALEKVVAPGEKDTPT